MSAKDDVIHLRVDDDLKHMLTELRRYQTDVCNQSEMLRRLIRAAYKQLSSKQAVKSAA